MWSSISGIFSPFHLEVPQIEHTLPLLNMRYLRIALTPATEKSSVLSNFVTVNCLNRYSWEHFDEQNFRLWWSLPQ